MILQHERPDDFVIATGQQHTVREFCERAFSHAGMELRWEGEGADEKGVCTAVADTTQCGHLVGRTLVEVSPDFYRPTDVVNLLGDPAKARRLLGWNPAKTSFDELVKLMVENDMAKVASDDAAARVRCNLAEYLEKGIVK